MQTYKQTVRFVRRFTITAKDAAEANEKLEEAIRDAEFSANVACDSFDVFEDEPVTCPKCKGDGIIGDGEITCDQCKGEGQIPFSA